jgi:plasmid stabilization system protein ParE
MEEARAAYRWYAERNPLAAFALAAELEHATQAITEHPTRWSPYLGSTRRFLLHRFPFMLVYREHGDSVQALAGRP